jgi:hypothetical protein
MLVFDVINMIVGGIIIMAIMIIMFMMGAWRGD